MWKNESRHDVCNGPVNKHNIVASARFPSCMYGAHMILIHGELTKMCWEALRTNERGRRRTRMATISGVLNV